MKRRLMLAALVVAILAALAIPVWSALKTRRYTLPVNKYLCVDCQAREAGLWALYANPKKAIFKCVKVKRAWRNPTSCNTWYDKIIELKLGEKLIVKGGGDAKRRLYLNSNTPHIFTVSNW